MGWHAIDFQGIVALDQRIVEQLNRYLQEKESRLAHQILNMLEPVSQDQTSPILSTPQIQTKLAEAVDHFTRKIRQMSKSSTLSVEQKRELIKDINAILWEITEVLEGCVIELFQQLKQIHVDKWRKTLFNVVQEIKDLLLQKIDDLIWLVRRLEETLNESGKKKQKSIVTFLSRMGQSSLLTIDPAISNHLLQSQQLLNTQYEEFQSQYKEYVRLNARVEDELEKMKNYPVLAVLDLMDQNLYVDIFRLLKLYEFNPNHKEVLGQETIRALRHLCSVDGALLVFKVYLRGLKDGFFGSSLELKAMAKEFSNLEEARKRLEGKVKDYQYELIQLIATMSAYRNFMLETNPNPYVRSRWGFTERPVGPEPEKPRELLNLIYPAEKLKSWYDQFLVSLNRDPAVQQRRENHAHPEIDKLLHEMGQPLISKVMMQNRAERLLGQIKECDEIGSSSLATVQDIQEIFSRAMRYDWKYHVLHGFPLFHELYAQHRGLYHPIDDPSHAFRMENFKELFNQIEEWVYKEDVYAHIHEIELDINDMKIYLQDFLAAIQRVAREGSAHSRLDETIETFELELLEYRYTFGHFFHVIMSKSTEGQQLRNQFLFVDQYFDSIESLLRELKGEWQNRFQAEQPENKEFN